MDRLDDVLLGRSRAAVAVAHAAGAPASGARANTWRSALSGSGSARVPRRVDVGVDLGLDLGARSRSTSASSTRPLLHEVRASNSVSGSLCFASSTSSRRAVRAVVVVGGVREEPVRLALDERRALAGAGASHGGPRRLVARRATSLPSTITPAEAVGGRAVGDVVARPSACDMRHRIAYPLFSQNQTTGQLVDPGEVQALVPVALAGGALAEPAPDDGVLAAVLRRVGERRPRAGSAWRSARSR